MRARLRNVAIGKPISPRGRLVYEV